MFPFSRYADIKKDFVLNYLLRTKSSLRGATYLYSHSCLKRNLSYVRPSYRWSNRISSVNH